MDDLSRLAADQDLVLLFCIVREWLLTQSVSLPRVQ